MADNHEDTPARDLSRRPHRRPFRSIDEHGVPDIMPARESLIDRQVREAMAEGKFDDLPYQGEPLPKDDDALAGEWALAYRMLKNAGVAPPWIETDKEVRQLLERRDAILARAAVGPAPSPLGRQRDRATLTALVGEINRAIMRLNHEAPTDRQHRRPLSAADELARYDEACRR